MALKPWIFSNSNNGNSNRDEEDSFVCGSDDEDAVMIEAPAPSVSDTIDPAQPEPEAEPVATEAPTQPVVAVAVPEPEPVQTSSVESIIRRVVPDENVDEVMTQFKGREEELVETLRTMQERSIARPSSVAPSAPPAVSEKATGAVVEVASVESSAPADTKEQNDADENGSVADNISVPAAVAGSVTGLIIGGPILAVAGGVGAAIASTKEGPAGDIARASGEVAVSVGAKAKEVDEKHQFVERTRETVQEAWTRVREFDEKHGTTAGIRAFFTRTRDRAVEFERENRVMENALIKIAERAQNLAEWFRKQSEEKTDSDGWTDAGAEVEDIEKTKN